MECFFGYLKSVDVSAPPTGMTESRLRTRDTTDRYQGVPPHPPGWIRLIPVSGDGNLLEERKGRRSVSCDPDSRRPRSRAAAMRSVPAFSP